MYLPVPKEYESWGYFAFIHNKNQMYFPKVDGIYGSDLIFITFADIKTGCLNQAHKIEKTHWNALDTPSKRCDPSSSGAKTTECLTRYLEHTIGCSMGMAKSDAKIAL